MFCYPIQQLKKVIRPTNNPLQILQKVAPQCKPEQDSGLCILPKQLSCCRKLRIRWNKNNLEHHTVLVLGVKEPLLADESTLKPWDRRLRHCIFQPLLASTLLSACHFVWTRLCHANKFDPEPNKSGQIIIDTLKSTPLPILYGLASIQSHHKNWEAQAAKWSQALYGDQEVKI